MPARLPSDEASRLQVLGSYAVLDTAPEPAFERLVQLASRLLRCPIVLISLVDENRQWFKARVGLEACDTSRDLSFCAHALLGDETLVIPDATADPRFRGNPLVTGKPGIRFYAGALLVTPDGYKLGTLCAIDTMPRAHFPVEDRETLEQLAALVVDAMEFRRAHWHHTERSNIERHQLATHLGAVVEAAPLALVTVDPDGLITGWNPAAERIFGWSADEAMGQFAPFVGVRYKREWRSLQVRLRQGEFLVGVEAQRRHKSGKPVDVLIAAAPLHDAQGRYAGTLALVDDITGRKAAEAERARVTAELVRVRGHLDAVLESTSDAILAADAHGRIVGWNRGAETLFGYQSAEILGQPITHLMAERFHDRHREHMEQMLREGTSRFVGRLVELDARRKDGSLVPIELTLSVWDHGEGMFGAIIRNVEERKRVEAELRENAANLTTALHRAEAAHRAKGDFLATMGHELRTPLNAVIGFAELMDNQLFGPLGHPNYRTYTTSIAASGRHLLRLINDVLDFAKAGDGQVMLDLQPVELHGLISRAIRMIERKALEGRVELDIQEVGAISVTADPERLRRVLLNLLSNAVKFTPPGGSVTVSVKRTGKDGIAIQVADTGIGIAAEDVPRVFDPFTQLDSSLSRRYEGTGLGLSLAKRAIAEFG